MVQLKVFITLLTTQVRSEKLTRTMTISNNLRIIGQSIRAAEKKYQRPLNSVQLLAVSKRHSNASILEALAAGQTAFGENYAQEMLTKAEQLTAESGERKPIDWHFIGPLQSNKTRQIAATAQWVHTVDRLKIARRLSDQKPEQRSDINICLQVNISDESSKSGITPEELPELAGHIAELPGLKLRGLMAIPAISEEFEQQRGTFAKLRELQESLIKSGLDLDTLSMGMSGDMEAAIAEGATIVRIGTAIFGQRDR